MNNWIAENINWIGPAIITAISTVWAYITSRSKKKLEEALQAVQVELQKTEVDTAHLEINEKVNKAVDAALERAIQVHENELTRLNSRYAREIDELKVKMKSLRSEMEEATILKDQALDLSSTYRNLIDELQRYNMYLKAVLDANQIKYKEQNEL